MRNAPVGAGHERSSGHTGGRRRRGTDAGGEAGRRARFERIFHAGYEPVMAYALRRAGTPEDAADVVADTFLVAWRRLDHVPEPPAARLWLFATARRVLANHHRGQRRRLRLAGALLAARTDHREEPEIPLVAAAFGRLKAADREVLALAGWEGLDAAEIADVLGCSAGTARVRLHRARRRFADQLAAEGGAGPGIITYPQRGGRPGHEPGRRVRHRRRPR